MKNVNFRGLPAFQDSLSMYEGVEVREGEFVVVTADSSDKKLYQPIAALLERIRNTFDMDVVFISQFVDGYRLVRHVAADPGDAFAVPEGASDPLEESYCHLIVQGRLPQVIKDTKSQPLAMSWQERRRARSAVTSGFRS